MGQQSLGLPYAQAKHDRRLMLRQTTFQQPVHHLGAIQLFVAGLTLMYGPTGMLAYLVLRLVAG